MRTDLEGPLRRPFTFPVQPAELLAERARQMRAWGVPAAALARAGADIGEMWQDGPGGWTHAWMREAEAAERAGRWREAAMLYGAARFPCMSDARQQEAYARQLACFERAARKFPCYFERRLVQVPYREGTIPVAAHFYAAFWHGRDHWQKLPLVVLSGGASTGKVELHRLALALTIAGNFLVVAIDMPGTGESTVPLAGDAEAIYAAVLRDFARDLGGERPVAAFGLGFGGHWAAKLALRGLVDAAVCAGGPIGAEAPDAAAFPNGRAGVLAHALGLGSLPEAADLPGLLAPFSLAGGGWLDPGRAEARPLLVFNGARDPYVPAADTRVFAGHPQATAWLFAAGGHAAGDRLGRVAPAAIAWLRTRLHAPSALERLALGATGALLPRRLAL